MIDAEYQKLLKIHQFLTPTEYLGLLCHAYDRQDPPAKEMLIKNLSDQKVIPVLLMSLEQERQDIAYDLKNKMDTIDLGWAFQDACGANNLRAIKYLLAQEDLMREPSMIPALCLGFQKAYKKKDWPLVKYLLTSPEVTQYEVHRHLNTELSNALCHACEDGCLEMVEFLRRGKEITLSGLNHANARSGDYRAINFACAWGWLPVVKDLLNHHDKEANLVPVDGKTLANACASGNLELVQHLMNLPDPTGHVRMTLMLGIDSAIKSAMTHQKPEVVKYLLNELASDSDQKVFKTIQRRGLEGLAFFWQHPSLRPYLKQEGILEIAIQQSHTAVAQYLIFEQDMPKTASINATLNDCPDSTVAEMFAQREFEKHLQSELPKQGKGKRAKI